MDLVDRGELLDVGGVFQLAKVTVELDPGQEALPPAVAFAPREVPIGTHVAFRGVRKRPDGSPPFTRSLIEELAFTLGLRRGKGLLLSLELKRDELAVGISIHHQPV